jgi:hypothetical protein
VRENDNSHDDGGDGDGTSDHGDPQLQAAVPLEDSLQQPGIGHWDARPSWVALTAHTLQTFCTALTATAVIALISHLADGKVELQVATAPLRPSHCPLSLLAGPLVSVWSPQGTYSEWSRYSGGQAGRTALYQLPLSHLSSLPRGKGFSHHNCCSRAFKKVLWHIA